LWSSQRPTSKGRKGGRREKGDGKEMRREEEEKEGRDHG